MCISDRGRRVVGVADGPSFAGVEQHRLPSAAATGAYPSPPLSAGTPTHS